MYVTGTRSYFIDTFKQKEVTYVIFPFASLKALKEITSQTD